MKLKEATILSSTSRPISKAGLQSQRTYLLLKLPVWKGVRTMNYENRKELSSPFPWFYKQRNQDYGSSCLTVTGKKHPTRTQLSQPQYKVHSSKPSCWSRPFPASWTLSGTLVNSVYVKTDSMLSPVSFLFKYKLPSSLISWWHQSALPVARGSTPQEELIYLKWRREYGKHHSL